MVQSPASISRALRFSLAGCAIPYPLKLTYSTSAPWQVALDFPHQAAVDRRAPRWVIGRDLLLAGLREPHGEGDVRVVPQGAATVLNLRGSTGASWLTVRTAVLRAFLDETQALVPVGQEGGYIDWDAVVALLQQR